MAGIIEKNAYLQLILKQAGEIIDGKYSWIDTECRGMILDMQTNDFNQFSPLEGGSGTLHDGKVFLLAPLKFEPLLPAKIVYDGKEYDIKGLKTLRNIRGVVLGHRLVAAGG